MPRLLLCCTGCLAVFVGVTGFDRMHQHQVPGVRADSIIEGVFEGRTPCAPIALAFTGFPSGGCEKIKWEITLYRDAGTAEPAGFRYRGTRTSRSETWSITRGIPTDSLATVYELRYDGGVLRLLAVDANVLLLLDADRRLMVGDASWSYTFNRTDRRDGGNSS